VGSAHAHESRKTEGPATIWLPGRSVSGLPTVRADLRVLPNDRPVAEDL